jgi:hypothetical protein
VVPGDPGLEVELDVPLAVPGNVPQGDPAGDVPLEVPVFVVPVFVVDDELPAGVVVFGEVEPGMVVFGVPVGELDVGVLGFCGDACGVAVPVGDVGVPADGVAVPAGGVAVLAGGVAVLAGGVAGEPGVELCPEVVELPAGCAPPVGVPCDMAQLAQPKITDSSVIFDFVIFSHSPT